MQSIKAKAFALLAKRAYFSKALSLKLQEKGYPQKEIESLLQELKSQGWLNDEELATRYVERQKSRGYGARLIALKLREKAGEIDIPIEESEEALRTFIEKRYLKDLPEKRDKVIRALMRRGYSYPLINKILTSIS